MKRVSMAIVFVLAVTAVGLTGCSDDDEGAMVRDGDDRASVEDAELDVPVPEGWKAEESRVEAVTDEGKTGEKTITYYTNPQGMEFVWIRPGEFMMGSPRGEEGRYDDETQHLVKLTKGFFLSATAVTNAQYRHHDRDHDSGDYNGKSLDGDNQPVVGVSWNDATDYCQWLSREDAAGYRLPTEAEWEYACRAGTKTPFNFGSDQDELWRYANYADKNTELNWSDKAHDDGYAVTAPVGKYPVNAWGLYDMHGNVYEWCSDWHDSDYYENSDKEDPKGPDSGSTRVLRGGSWNRNPRDCRSAYRRRYLPSHSPLNVGFRIVYSPR